MSQPPERPYHPQQPYYPQQPQYPQQGPQSGQPDYQQPDYQQPGYQQPGYQQPGYPPESQQPGYQQPGYPPESQQPGYPQSGPPAPPQPTPKKSGAGKIVLIVLAVLVVLCGGGATVAYLALKDDVKGAAEAAQIRLVAPDTVAGRKKITDAQLQQVATQMVDGMKKEMPDASSTIGAFYGDLAKQDMFMVAGASGLVHDAGKQLDDAFKALGEAGLKLGEAKDVEPGPLGGHAKCTDGQAEGVQLAMCVWADSGSVGLVAVYFKKVDQVTEDFVKIRGEIEQKN